MAFAPGTFSWIELATTDVAAARAFYAGLFGWTFVDSAMPDGGVYTRAQLGAGDIGGMFRLSAEAGRVPPHWGVYIAVASADDGVAAVAAAGGAVVEAAFDVPDHGRMAVLRDPTGAFFNLWQARGEGGATAFGAGPGSWSWVELATTDTDRAAAFYARVFGWSVKAHPGYTEFSLGGGPEFAGMLAIDPSWGPVPPHWTVYFDVADADAASARAVELGGRVLRPTLDVPGVGRIATLGDPQGAAFAIYQRRR
jgi:predicted enzyme related to lactoylglutathione lyase